MLAGLGIRNIVLIDALDLAFRPGLNVLTGETGAGKSILLDALGFALGRKGRRDLVMEGAGEGSVTAVFELPEDHAVFALLAEVGLSHDPGELILRRVQAPGGPARGFVNDQRASADVMARIGALLVEVHGQHDERGLLDPRAHRPLLDAYGGHARELRAVTLAWADRRAAEQALEAARARMARAVEDADWLRHAVEELTRADPQPGEEAALDAERRLIRNAVAIREEMAKAATRLSGEGAEGQMGDALSRLTRVAEQAEGRLDAPVAALDRAMAELTEAQAGLDAAIEAMTFDPGRLDTVEERLFALRALARKHQVLPEALPELAATLSARLAEIDAGEERLAGLERAVATARAAWEAAAEALTDARRAAALKLDQAVTAELAPLRMEAARFRTEIAPGPPGAEGADTVSFTARINPGSPGGAIDRIASGGELSRFLLALKVCLAARAPGVAMIFDEIDRGVGGATADAVGRRLHRLAGGAQVLVVTHSPQVAAQGSHHWRIEKRLEAGVARTRVEALDAGARIDEIARMLAGDEITEAARAAARSLVEKAV